MAYADRFNQGLPYGAHVIILFTLVFASLVLSILVTFSSPFISSINFLCLPAIGGDTTFGAFGWCSPSFCLPNKVAYEFGTEVNRALTGGMFLWPIAVIFLFFAFLSILPLLFVHESRALRFVGNRTFFLAFEMLATLITVTAWLFSIYGWSIAHRAFQEAATAVHLGPAIWMGLTAAICMLIVFVLGWPRDAWDGVATRARGGAGARGLPGQGDGYYHYKRTTREVVPRY
ncbi:hypothetical protein M231_06289 [Tremella mesenterica]|uniref:MARVEL domain-containing protein n=1 Tax=Tremella mesenterica TaxID=5217 RepID=A0A4Q1BFB4_TREME|nr:uncharacterized protein TREMEDRAFT_30407 [Tremella mesenterica DSM 1558]EIW69681.1 hypothetical protein TREMEDRAFT_30407 [Tremella mesenterica DSM 1558]RXK36445.1 hypothetical protein M231_06289 [Tremella mesenterica]